MIVSFFTHSYRKFRHFIDKHKYLSYFFYNKI